MLNRRRLLTAGGLALGGVVGGTLLLPQNGTTRAAANTSLGAHGHMAHGMAYGTAHGTAPGRPSPPVAPFRVRMPVPRVLTPVASHRDVDVYQQDIQPASVEMLPGIRTEVLGYGGGFVGPTIRARSGRRVVVRYRNGLDRAVNTHLHGGHVAASNDGYPMDLIEPGRSRYYEYPNNQPGATLWYHDHTHHREAEHVYRGMHGFYLLEGEDERRLRLPSKEYDVPIMLTDAHFNENGALIYAPEDTPNRNTLLANGRPQPYFPVAARRYRFRLLNVSNFRTFHLRLDGMTMTQIGSDGGLLPAPVNRDEVVLSPGERAEVVVDFAGCPIGGKVVLNDVSGPVLRFDVVTGAADDSRVPDVLRPLPALPSLPAGRTDREITLKVDMVRGAAYINGKVFDPDRVDARVRRGSTEVWRITNLDTDIALDHNLHLHLVQFRILDRDGAPPLPGESGLKDTVLVPAGTSVRIQVTFGDFLGRYLYHCHMLEHSVGGMMAQMEIVA
ncbi:multicopper oxidase domain-containing protein [Streptosporangium sp. NPDC051023]|uniref:multicopper oxidase family protein n=1 Tax=Streptosporangium sp. NPDC051023 TaxID=3155410 RepID=UPI00344F7DE0